MSSLSQRRSFPLGTKSNRSTVVTVPGPCVKPSYGSLHSSWFLPVLSFTVDCEHTWDPSISTQSCAFKPWCPQWAVLRHCFHFVLFGCHHRHVCAWTPAAALPRLLLLWWCFQGSLQLSGYSVRGLVSPVWACVRCILETSREEPPGVQEVLPVPALWGWQLLLAD